VKGISPNALPREMPAVTFVKATASAASPTNPIETGADNAAA
jgi:hypothetical protein